MSGPPVKYHFKRNTPKAPVKLNIRKHDGYTKVMLLNRRLCTISNDAEHSFSLM
jgi:hypothetical protein